MHYKPWEQVVAENFAELRHASVTHPMMAEIETALNVAPATPDVNTKTDDHTAAFEEAQQKDGIARFRNFLRTPETEAEAAAAALDVAWLGLFAREFSKSLEASDRAIEINPNDLVAVRYRAHALMFLARTKEAKTIYLAHRGETLLDKKWEQVIPADFGELRKAGITSPLMTEIEATLAAPAQSSIGAKQRRTLPPAPTAE